MLHVTSGSRLFIADSPKEDLQPEVSALPGAGWVEVSELEAIGLLGGEWETSEAELSSLSDDRLGGGFLVAKRARRALPMQLVLGLDPENAGQLLLWEAYRVTDAYPFRLLFPDGVTSRGWWGLVTAISEVFDAANSVMRLQVEIRPCSDVER